MAAFDFSDPATDAYSYSEAVADALDGEEAERYFRDLINELFELHAALRRHFSDLLLIELKEAITREEDSRYAHATITLIERIEQDWRKTMTEQYRPHRMTRKAADMALAKRAISRESHRAITEGRITLAEARELGRDGSPYAPAVRVNKDDRTPTETPCLCGCGLMVPRRFAPGHDARMFRVAREHLTEGRELTGEQIEYLEASGKMGRVLAKLAEERRRREENTEKQRGQKK